MTESFDGITRFLPKYPNIVPFEDNLLDPYNGMFYNTIYKKKEFYDLRLSKVENVPEEPGDLMNHQKIIARYLSSHTPYDGALLFHEMGTGKTCSAVGAIEQIKSEGKFRGAIYIASITLSKNFLNELINVCTDGRYIPEDLGNTDRIGKIRMKKAVSDYYKLGNEYTYAKFAKTVSKLSINAVRKRYNNHVIVIDEVHNLADNNKEGASYKIIWKFLHQIQGCKVLLLSGTPIRNKVWDIASVMNLILPESNQLPTGELFINEYCTRVDKNLDLLTSEGAKKLKTYFKGRVSYLRGITSDIERVFHGNIIKIPNFKQLGFFKVSELTMSKFQTNAYMNAWSIDKKETSSTLKGSGYYRNSRQASLFVFPDGSWGTKGFEKYIYMKKSTNFLGKKRKGKHAWTKVGKAFAQDLRTNGIKKLAQYSCKYAASCKIINEAIDKQRLIFVYNDSVREGGVILFTMILQALGFVQTSGQKVSKDKKTFAVLTGDTANKSTIINYFNQSDNTEGDRINLIIGSQAVAEGITLKNVQVEIVQTAWFNYTRIDQALARGYRAGSHRVLVSKKGEIIQDIYLQAAVPLKSGFPPPSSQSTDLVGIDLQMYRIAQKKDISFKKIELVMRASAFDCALTYKRNLVIGRPDSRECNYSNCDYKCNEIPEEEYQGTGELLAKDLDYSTYQLYYSDEKVNSLIFDIVGLFKTKFILSFQEIDTFISSENEFDLLTALDSVISNSVPIYNKYGFTSYLQEENDMYFLVDSISTIGSASMAYYTKYPNVKTKQPFSTIKEKYFSDIALSNAINDLCDTKGALRPYLERLPLEYREMFLENSVKVEVLKERGMYFQDHQIELANKIIRYFDPDIFRIEDSNLIVSSLMFTNGGNLRCLDTNGNNKKPNSLNWQDCVDKDIQTYTDKKIARRQELEKEAFYGQINRKIGRFCIRDCRKGCDEDVLGHRMKSGAQCYTTRHSFLTLIATFYTTMPVPPTESTVSYILANRCGPPRDKNEPGVFTPSQIAKIQQKISKGNIVIGSGSSKIKVANNKKDLCTFLLNCVDNVKKYAETKEKVNPAVAKKWFGKPNGELFEYLVQRGDKDSKDPWIAVKAGIKVMSREQLQRMVFYGTLQKVPMCMFLCSWFNDNNLLVNDSGCGSGTKPKPINKKMQIK